MALGSIGVGYDGSETSRAALVYAVKLTHRHGATLAVVTAVPRPVPAAAGILYGVDWDRYAGERTAEAAAELEALKPTIGSSARAEVREGSPEAVLEALSHEVDLIVVGSRGWGPARRVILGSAADRLLRRAACPVVVTPRPG